MSGGTARPGLLTALFASTALILTSLVGAFAPLLPASAASCQFVLGFKAVRDLIPDQVGECLADERHNPQNGDTLQATTGRTGKGGLLVWRKSDNWTAYTDGYWSWVNGPNGLQRRLNSARFAWERDPIVAPAAAPRAAVTSPGSPRQDQPPSVAPPTKTGAGQPPTVSAAYVAIVDEASGALLYDRGAHQRSAPASITKIATAIVAFERGSPATRVKARFDASELVDSTLMGLRQGDEVTLEDLLYGLMLPSGNDAALAIAEHIAGSKDAFVQMMNDRVRALGLTDTQFKNPHGLDQVGHYSSAYDMAMLTRHGMRHYPLFAKLSSARYWDVRGSRSYRVYNLNRLLGSYPGADGVKVGYTENAGRTFVGSATRDGHRVYVVLMKSGNLWADSPPLLDYVFDNYTWAR